MLIPAGNNLGHATASAAQAPRINARALNGGINEAVESLGRSVTNIGLQGASDQYQADQQRQRDELQQAKEAKQVADAADRARAGAVTTTVSDQLDDLQSTFDEGVQNGSIDKKTATAKFQEQASKLVTDSLADAPDAHRAIIQNQLTGRALRLENKVGRSVLKRDRSDIQADLSTTIEASERLAVDDRELGMQRGMAAIDALATAGVPPAEIAKRKQAFTENVSYNLFLRATNMARTDNAQLRQVANALTADKDIDPTRQTQMLGTISGYQAVNDQRAEAAAARAERQAAARERRAESAFNVYQGIAMAGRQIDPAFVEQTMKTVAGTPYAAGVAALAQQAVETGGLASQPIAAQQQRLDAINSQIAKGGLNPALERQRTQIQSVLTASRSDLQHDPMRAGLERGVITQIDPIDASSVQGVVAGIGKRITQSQTVSQWAGQVVSPLTADEADQVGSMLTKLPPAQRSVAISTMSSTLGPQVAGAVARQLNEKDRPLALAFATASDKTSPATNMWGNPVGQGRYTSELILLGAQAKKDGTSTKSIKGSPDVAASKWRADIAAQLHGVFPSQTTTNDVLDAAELITHGIASEQGGNLSEADRTRAIRLAIGGDVADFNGSKVILPGGWKEDDLRTSLKNSGGPQVLQQAGGAPVRAGGVEIPASQLIDKLPASQLMFAGKNRYMVIVQGRPVLSSQGKPITIEAR